MATPIVLPKATECVALTRMFYTPDDRPDDLLDAQLLHANETLMRLVTAPLATHQWQALACLVSDIEAGLSHDPNRTSFERSFLLWAVNKAMFSVACAEFHQFCYQHGKLEPRVWQKRRAETILFRDGTLIF
jgi:GH24 family phage-related lysozyme (muramidase)